VKRIAIAGGIGAGKSAVTARLVALGWPVVDADTIARHVSASGTPAWRALRDAFGDAVLDTDGEIDRPFLADVVFHDASALARLNRITHGPIGLEILRQLDATTGAAAFAAIPLFRPEHRELLSLNSVWAVQVKPETAIERLCRQRGYAEEDARARSAVQMTNEERAALVDRVLWNEGTLEELYDEIDGALRDEGLAGG
jgi:dephospho-CoA kinase